MEAAEPVLVVDLFPLERQELMRLDRLTHRATILEFVGTSYRFRQELHRQEVPED